VVLADVLVRSKDLGRRRALGATRGTIISLVTLRTLGPALLGAALGTGLGIYLTHRLDATPPWQFTTGTATLALLAALAAAIPPALYAATRDPVRVLRTP
jgi:putative ABC transport system permease protein